MNFSLMLLLLISLLINSAASANNYAITEAPMTTSTLWNEEEVGLVFDPLRKQVLLNSAWRGIAVLDADKNFIDDVEVFLDGGRASSRYCVAMAYHEETDTLWCLESLSFEQHHQVVGYKRDVLLGGYAAEARSHVCYIPKVHFTDIVISPDGTALFTVESFGDVYRCDATKAVDDAVLVANAKGGYGDRGLVYHHHHPMLILGNHDKRMLVRLDVTTGVSSAIEIVDEALPSDIDPVWERYGLVFLGDGRLVLVASPHVLVLEEVDSDAPWSKARIVDSIQAAEGDDAIVLLNSLSRASQEIYLLYRSSDTNYSPHRLVTIHFTVPSANTSAVEPVHDLPEIREVELSSVDTEEVTTSDDESEVLPESTATSAAAAAAAISGVAVPARNEGTELGASDEASRSTASNAAPYTPPPLPSAATSTAGGDNVLVPMLLGALALSIGL